QCTHITTYNYIYLSCNDTAPAELYTLSLHDALPIWGRLPGTKAELLALKGIGRYTAGALLTFAYGQGEPILDTNVRRVLRRMFLDRKSTRLNSSHDQISYAVFCLKKKKPKLGSQLPV